MYTRYGTYQGKATDAYTFEAKTGSQGLVITVRPNDPSEGPSLDYTIWLTDGGLRQVQVLEALKVIGHPIETLQTPESWDAIGADLKKREPEVSFEMNTKERGKDSGKFDDVAGWIGAPNTSRPKQRTNATLGAGVADVAKRAAEFAAAVAGGADPKEYLKKEVPF